MIYYLKTKIVYALFFCITFCICLPGIIFSQSTFYVKNGNSITKVENSDPSKFNVTEWQVRLYKTGASTSSNNYWGLITGKSADEVMKKLKAGQDFELRYNEWAGKGRVQDNPLTNFNPLGPIAVVETNTQQSSAQQKREHIAGNGKQNSKPL